MSYQQTEHLVVDNHVNGECVVKAARLLQQEELVAFPTETVYGLGAHGLSTRAVQKIFAAKGRPSDNPLILHIGSLQQLDPLIEMRTSVADPLIQRYWPGPLTLIFRASPQVPAVVTAGLDTVAVRMPAHELARAIITEASVPVAAPSANRSGRPSPTSVEHVYEDLEGRVAAIIDGGNTGYGLESTVLDVSGGGDESPRILRPGGITAEEIEETLGFSLTSGGAQQVRSPGMKYRHYAPETKVVLVDGSAEMMQERVNAARDQGKKVAVAVTADRAGEMFADEMLILGDAHDLAGISARLYEHLRAVDKLAVDIVFIQTFDEKGLGSAIMNRLSKAAGHSGS
ncbi:L-threonylcarbamoyladenylate synthase [Natribacillus halophilus]|uniref:Threonylcarbamoyl-AMP synthase n=1 Tax=Natribacillus halophilus TaxID=549003 RepID=A0A1G8KV35_9BACI|nr:L-threonylcarbamoyladenylate synthase [Natribacillus halophilus]SDI47262.1 translation factor SUA5 [Natribacillus halophilus]